MNFVAPLFLVGGLAIAAPILFHLIRRTTRDVTPFSTLMFLQPTPPRITRRSRLENLWLLLLRCLVLALLALGFGRPFFQRAATSTPPATGMGGRTVFLIDTSASMRREKLWDDARTKVEARLRTATAADEIAVLTFDQNVRTVVSFEEWKTLGAEQRIANTIQRLADSHPGWSGTRLDAALIKAAELFDRPGEEEPRRKEIVVISDLQEGTRLDGVQGYEWGRGIEVVLEPVTAHQLHNASAAWIPESDDSVGKADGVAQVRLKVTNAAESKRDQYTIQWAGSADRQDVYVPAGQSRMVRAQKQDGAATSLLLSGDDVEFDNTLFAIPPQTVTVPIFFAGQDAEDDPRGSLYYVRRAFPRSGRQIVEIATQRTPGVDLQKMEMIVLGNDVPDTALDSVKAFVRNGKTAVIALTAAADAQTIAKLFDQPGFTASEAAPKDYALLAKIDFQHPIFAPFADPRFSDFTKIHFWKHRRINAGDLAGAKVVAAFDDGDPAIVQAPLGNGNVVIFTSSWRPVDSQLALSTKFVPLMNALLEQSSRMPAQKAQYFVGDEIALPPGTQAVIKPDGERVEAAARFTETDEPGIYTVMPGTLRYAVNLPVEESRTVPLANERFTTLGIPLRKSAMETPRKTVRQVAATQAIELEASQKLWRWLIVAALAALIFETVFAAKLSGAASSGNVSNL
ncbi:MAG: N-terminal double-transrane protein [Chthoniobacteraceae bacterium]|nr:N-terminal double-transrane protein [Chthoniobacteraceae bacterium]